MSNPWFRLYAETVNDPKVLIMPEALRWRYVALLCLHCDDKYENRPDDEIALALRITEDEWVSTRNEFVKRTLLTHEHRIKAWEKRQYISDIKDPTAAERQKRYREKKRDERNGTVTLRPPESDTDTEEDTSYEVSSPPATQSVSRENKKPSHRPAKPDGVSDAVWFDFVSMRKQKRARLSQTALDGIQREATKAGWSLEEALRECCTRGWQSFKAEWVNKSTGGNNGTHQQKHTYQQRLDAAGAEALADIYADIDARYGTGEGEAPGGSGEAELCGVPHVRQAARVCDADGESLPDGSGYGDLDGDFERLQSLDAGEINHADTGGYSGPREGGKRASA